MFPWKYGSFLSFPTPIQLKMGLSENGVPLNSLVYQHLLHSISMESLSIISWRRYRAMAPGHCAPAAGDCLCGVGGTRGIWLDVILGISLDPEGVEQMISVEKKGDLVVISGWEASNIMNAGLGMFQDLTENVGGCKCPAFKLLRNDFGELLLGTGRSRRLRDWVGHQKLFDLNA